MLQIICFTANNYVYICFVFHFCFAYFHKYKKGGSVCTFNNLPEMSKKNTNYTEKVEEYSPEIKRKNSKIETADKHKIKSCDYFNCALSHLSIDESLNAVIQSCDRRAKSWRIPPNRSRCDWFEEIDAIKAIAFWKAETVYDPSSGIKLEAFIYQKIMAKLLTHYRREWRYALRFIRESDSANQSLPDKEIADTGINYLSINNRQYIGGLENDTVQTYELYAIIKTLSSIQQQIIILIYLHGYTESEISKSLGISQRAVNKRKHVILKLLREKLV